MNSYNKGIFIISEEKSYTMNPVLSYQKFKLPTKLAKNCGIKSKPYRRWAHNQKRILKRKGMEIIRNKRPSFMDSSFSVSSSPFKYNNSNNYKLEKKDEEFLKSLLKPKTKRTRTHQIGRYTVSKNYTGRV